MSFFFKLVESSRLFYKISPCIHYLFVFGRKVTYKMKKWQRFLRRIYAHTCIFYMKLIMPFKKRAVSSEVFPSIFKNKKKGYPIQEISNDF